MPEEAELKRSKDLSRGISTDMSPEAISKRFEILVELNELCDALMNAERLGTVEPSERLKPEASQRVARG